MNLIIYLQANYIIRHSVAGDWFHSKFSFPSSLKKSPAAAANKYQVSPTLPTAAESEK
jgi:hypothetical protein